MSESIVIDGTLLPRTDYKCSRIAQPEHRLVYFNPETEQASNIDGEQIESDERTGVRLCSLLAPRKLARAPFFIIALTLGNVVSRSRRLSVRTLLHGFMAE